MADLTQQQKLGMELIGKLISTERAFLINLLESYGWSLDPNVSAKTLTGIVLETLEHKGAEFVNELIQRFDLESHFTGTNSPVQLGADPISAVAGAIGSVANLVQTATNRKQIKKQAQAATLTALLHARTPQQIIYSPPRPKRKVWPWIIGGIVLLGSIGTFIYFNSQTT